MDAARAALARADSIVEHAIDDVAAEEIKAAAQEEADKEEADKTPEEPLWPAEISTGEASSLTRNE